MTRMKALLFTIVLNIFFLSVSAGPSYARYFYKVTLKNGGVIPASSYNKKGNIVYFHNSSGTIGIYGSDIKEIRKIEDSYDHSRVDIAAESEDNSTLKISAKPADPKKNFESETAKKKTDQR